MASHTAKRPRTDAGPSSAGQHDPLLAPTITTPRSSSAESHAAPAPASQPLSVPETMTMPLHEALAYIDPYDKTPHDLYLVLIYAAAAHSDVAEMVDRFACTHRDQISLQRDEMRGTPGFRGLGAQLVPVLPPPPPARPGRPHGPARPKEVVQAEKAEKEARKAARKQAQQERKAGAVRRKMNIPAKDKSFTYLVRQTEEELGWTGKYDDNGPKQHWSQNKKRQHWHSKAVDVEANVTWMQERILQNMADRERRAGKGVVVDVATFGTKKNALFAMKDIIHTILADTGEIGAQLRDNWFSKFLNSFKKALGLLSLEESAMLRKDRKWIKELRSLIGTIRAKRLPEEVWEEILVSSDPDFTIEADSSGDEDEGSDGSDSLDGSGNSFEKEFGGAQVAGQFLEHVHFEHCDDLEAESVEEENSEIG